MANKKRRAAKARDKKAVESAGVAPPSPPAPAGSDPTPNLPVLPLGDFPPTERNRLGQWIRGQSGNAKGKPKGLRNYVQRERLALEAALRSYISQDGNLEKVLEGIERMFTIMSSARSEDKDAIAAFKALSDKLLTAPKDSGDSTDGPTKLTVVITNARGGDEPPMRVIEGDFEEVEDDE